MRRKVLARSVRGVIEKLESRTLMSATYAANAGSGSITGIVYNDVNGNGVQDTNEPVIVGTTVTLSEVGVTYAPGTVPTVQTDANGAFSFTTLAPGQYTVGTIPSTGFVQDAPGSFIVSLTANDTTAINIGETSNINNGGTGVGTITGTVFNDNNQSGTYVPVVDDFLAGDTVYLDVNGSGTLTANDPTAITNNTGQYTFTVNPGSYLVRVVPRPGFHQDPPGYSQVVLYSDQTINQDIGENNRATLSGVLYNDVNSNGTQDPGEVGVVGETVFLDSNLDGLLEAGVYNPSTGHWDANPTTGGTEPYAITDVTGHYQFTGLTPGVYRIIVGSQVGLLQDAPGYLDVTLSQGQDLIQNVGEGVPVSIAGTVYDDRNGNGIKDPGEPGLPGQTVFLDVNNNGVDDAGVDPNTGLATGVGSDGLILSAPEPTVGTDVNGNFIFGDINPGTYTIRVILPDGAVPTGPPNATHSYTLTVPGGQIVSGEDFGFQTPDLTAQIVSYPTKPTLTRVPKTALVRITNVGSLPADGLAGITLWAQTVQTAVDTTTAFDVGELPGKMVRLGVGQSKVLKVSFEYPTQLPLNAYYVSAEVVSSVHDNNSSNDFSAPVGPVNVGPPYIDLGLTYASEPKLIVDPGQPTTIDLLLTNTGNVVNTGSVSFTIYASQTAAIEPTDVILKTYTLSNLRVAPGKSRIVQLTVPFPGQNLGFVYLNAYVDSGDQLGETNLLNNTAIEPSPTRFD